jgi:hypothetical protein
MPTLLSDDGRWYWNGQAWMPVPVPKDTATWWSDAPDWIGPVLLNGLIVCIPIVGQMVLYGWVLAARDQLRVGRNLVPPAGFGYLGRGWRPFLALLIWGLYWLALWVALGAALALSIAAAVQGEGGLWVLLPILIGAVGVVALICGILLHLALQVPIIAAAADLGVLAAINPGRINAVARAYPGALRQGLLINLIGSIAAISIAQIVPFFGGAMVASGTTISMAAPLAKTWLRPDGAP